jgi:hypothetical protein
MRCRWFPYNSAVAGIHFYSIQDGVRLNLVDIFLGLEIALVKIYIII